MFILQQYYYKIIATLLVFLLSVVYTDVLLAGVDQYNTRE